MHLNVHAFNLFISILNLKGYMYDVKVSIGTRINGIACIIDLPRARDLHFCPDARSGCVHWLQATSCQILSPVCDSRQLKYRLNLPKIAFTWIIAHVSCFVKSSLDYGSKMFKIRNTTEIWRGVWPFYFCWENMHIFFFKKLWIYLSKNKHTNQLPP